VTISPKQRKNNADHVLQIMSGEVGLDREYDLALFDAEQDARFVEIPPTTWRELLVARRIKALDGTAVYRLTGSGWAEGVAAAGFGHENAEIDQRCVAVVRALKLFTDRRSHVDTLADFDQLASASGTTKGWCFNAIASGFLEAHFPSDQVSVRIENHMVVRIPPTFGQKKLELFDSGSSRVTR
jgi:hypothetical protein